MIELVLVLIALFLISAFALAFWLRGEAKKKRTFRVAAPAQTVHATIRNHYKSVSWRDVQGPGDLNFKSRGPGLGSIGSVKPTVSYSLQQLDDGTTVVESWLAEWSSRGGIIGSADRVVLKRRSLLKRLSKDGLPPVHV